MLTVPYRETRLRAELKVNTKISIPKLTYMLLLSKYRVLEYLLWIKNNEFNKEEYSTFHQELNDCFKGITINIFNGGTKNLVYTFQVNNKQYMLKQFRDLPKSKRNYFKNESSILKEKNKPDDFFPNAIFIDDSNLIIIEEYLINFKNIGYVLENLIKQGSETENSIRIILTKIATTLKGLHQNQSLLNLPSQQISDIVSITYQPNFHKYYPLYEWTNDSFIHGDLNVNNILIDDDKNIKIIDWEMADKGDKYYDLSMIVKAICICSLSDFFFVSYGNSTQMNKQLKFLIIKQRVRFFLDAYDPQIYQEKEKLKSFLIISNTEGYKSENKAFLINIEALF